MKKNLLNQGLRVYTQQTETLSQFSLGKIMCRAISTAPLGFLLIDCQQEDNPVVYANQSYSEMTRQKIGEVLGSSFPFLPGMDTSQVDMERLKEAITTGNLYSEIIQIRGAAGKTNYFEFSVMPVSDEAGIKTHYAVMLKDYSFLGSKGPECGDFGRGVMKEGFTLYMENTHEGIWRIDMKIPLSLDAPEVQQMDHIFQHAVYGEANDAMARQYGFSKGREITGLALAAVMPRSEPKNVETISLLIRNRFRVNNFLSHERGPGDSNLVFLNNIIPCIREGKLLHVWGSSLNISELYESKEKLEKSEGELLLKKGALEKKNIALKEIVAHIEIEKKELRDKVRANLEQIILPSLDRISLQNESTDLFEQLRRSLKDLTSSLGLRLNDMRVKLTPREIEVCNLVKNGLTNKEISNLLNIAVHTVEKHRRMARKKLGLTNKGINLYTYLTSS